MARAGLGRGWSCAFANDFDSMKGEVYAANWGARGLKIADVAELSTADLPGIADLAWASFPCQDLSLAGNVAGLGTADCRTRSGAFWSFWSLIEALADEGRAPSMIVLENVYGVLTTNSGRDFAAICRCLALRGYRFGAVLIDAELFVPQSRARVFIVAFRADIAVPEALTSATPLNGLHPSAMHAAMLRLSEFDQAQWLWLRLPQVAPRSVALPDVIEDAPQDVAWHTRDETAKLVAMLSEIGSARLARMRAAGERRVGTIYKRTRPDATGTRVQRAELRDDGVAGCLRTPGGGSSRQIVVVVEGASVRTRLLSGREAARLMGLPDHYRLPPRYNDAYHVAGDGLVVPVVRFLAQSIIEPVLAAHRHPNVAIAAE